MSTDGPPETFLKIKTTDVLELVLEWVGGKR